ncbi:MAG: hypothetical protein ABI054_12635, partial [Planctomycetota bacterium]
ERSLLSPGYRRSAKRCALLAQMERRSMDMDIQGNVQSSDGKTVRQATRSLSEQTHRVFEDVKGLGASAVASAADLADQVRERGAAAYEAGKERASLAYDAGKERASVAKGQLETVISENPLKAVLLAVGIGALLGYSLRRR